MDTEDIRYFREIWEWEDLYDWFEHLIAEYKKWADWQIAWRQKRQESIAQLEFPYPYREGQRKLVADVYRTIIRRKTLFIQAPTGVGKTISTIFPAVKAVGEGLADRIFYLTAKTITATAARSAAIHNEADEALLRQVLLIEHASHVACTPAVEHLLAACGVRGGGPGHAQHAALMLQVIPHTVEEKLTLDAVARAAHAGAVGAAALDHKAGNNPMEDQAVVVVVIAQVDKVVNALGCLLGVQFALNDAAVFHGNLKSGIHGCYLSFIARSICRFASRSAAEARLSYSFLPLHRPTFTLTRLPLK